MALPLLGALAAGATSWTGIGAIAGSLGLTKAFWDRGGKDLFNKNWSGGNWKDRFGIEGDFKSGWEGGNWKDRMWGDGSPEGLAGSGDWLTKSSKWYEALGGREFDEAWSGGAWYRDRLGGKEFDEAWGGGAWQDRTGLTEFNKAWGGGAWLDDRLGFSQFDTDDPKKPKIDDVDTDDLDIPTDDTPIDDGLDDTNNDNDDDDDKKKEVTLTDPNIDSEELSPMAGDVQMSSYLASRRRQLRNKKGRTDTMLTRGAYLQDTDNRMMLS